MSPDQNHSKPLTYRSLGAHRNPKKGRERDSFKDKLEEQSIHSQMALSFVFYILMKIKSKVYKLFVIINNSTVRK